MMQAALQLFLPDKIHHWNATLSRNGNNGEVKIAKNIKYSFKNIVSQKMPPHGVEQRHQRRDAATPPDEPCEFPPEFWCSADPKITRACFSHEHCDRFARTNFGQPIQIRIIYNSQFEPSREYLLRYVAGKLLNRNSEKFTENLGKMQVELEPAHFTKRALAECGLGGMEEGRSDVGKGERGMGPARERRRRSSGCRRRMMEVSIEFSIFFNNFLN